MTKQQWLAFVDGLNKETNNKHKSLVSNNNEKIN